MSIYKYIKNFYLKRVLFLLPLVGSPLEAGNSFFLFKNNSNKDVTIQVVSPRENYHENRIGGYSIRNNPFNIPPFSRLYGENFILPWKTDYSGAALNEYVKMQSDGKMYRIYEYTSDVRRVIVEREDAADRFELIQSGEIGDNWQFYLVIDKSGTPYILDSYYRLIEGPRGAWEKTTARFDLWGK